MIFTRKVSRPIFFLLFILALSISAVASTTQAATTTMLHAQRTHSGNMVPMIAGTVTEFPIPTPGSQPVGITSGPCGDGTQCLWFTESHSNKIGKIITTGLHTGQITEYSLPSSPANVDAEPEGITSGPCGDGTQCLWFTEFSQIYGNNIGKITTNGQVTLYPIPTAKSEPESITPGPCGDGTTCLWFTEFNANNIGKITLSGQITEYAVPTANSEPASITSGPDGNIWFTEYYQIGTITIGDNITEYPLPSGSIGNLPDQITGGPDNNLWFTEFSGNNIGRITTN